ncbi:MAG: hypothetical protein QOE65_581 [Solirubrobacteraceae bacterium]|jgi:hypothetical protein|nr:hypothetical protein [Solirubrobacteraceae bacterium]
MADVRTGKGPPPDITAHIPGVKSGNSKGNYAKNKGHLPDGRRTARASTGVNPDAHGPIDPSMPNLSPA